MSSWRRVIQTRGGMEGKGTGKGWIRNFWMVCWCRWMKVSLGKTGNLGCHRSGNFSVSQSSIVIMRLSISNTNSKSKSLIMRIQKQIKEGEILSKQMTYHPNSWTESKAEIWIIQCENVQSRIRVVTGSIWQRSVGSRPAKSSTEQVRVMREEA